MENQIENKNFEIIVRKAVIEDINQIAKLDIENEKENLKEDLKENLKEEVVENGIKFLIENPKFGSFFVAENSGKIIGFYMINFEWSDWRNGMFWWLNKLFIQKEFRTEKIYSKFHQFVKDFAIKTKAVGFRSCIPKKNIETQKIFEELGMKEVDYYAFEDIFN